MQRMSHMPQQQPVAVADEVKSSTRLFIILVGLAGVLVYVKPLSGVV